jgi:protein O-GlcNAc transferase
MLDRLISALHKRLDNASSRLASLESKPDDKESLRSKGNAFLLDGKYVEAENVYRDVLSAHPNDVKTLVNLGFVLKEQKRLAEARVFLKRAITVETDHSLSYETHYLFGQIEEEQGQFEEARASFTAALEAKPEFAFACRDLCRILFLLGKMDAARAVLDKGLLLNPEYADFHYYQGNLYLESDQFDLAAKSYSKAITCGAVHQDVFSALGTVQYKLGHEKMALENFQRAMDIDPNCAPEAHYQAGCFCLRRGEYLNAITNFEKALSLRPGYTKVHSSLLFCLSFNPSGSPSYREAAQRYGNLLTALTKECIRPARHPYQRGTRPLNIGFVSGELKKHPVGSFLEGILRDMDPLRTRLIAYSNTSNTDQTTQRLRPLFTQWHEIKGLSDDAVAQMIRDHRIDILVDLGGHTGDNRLPLFARQPAALQVAWLGYFASTGVAEIDYILADRISIPETHSEFFSEKIWYLPYTRLCMTPPLTQREIFVTDPPAERNGYITFGCYQARTKINDNVLSVWSRVLAAVPDSVLRLQLQHLHIPELGEEFLQRMIQAGIDLARVSVSSGLPWEDYLDDYKNVDILLDTFPYPGGTTTAEALWMGVPTLTLMGNTMLSRQGASLLSCIGLHDWVASSEEDYVIKAVHFATDVPSLALLRAELRDRAIASPLFDTRRFANSLQACFEEMFLIQG